MLKRQFACGLLLLMGPCLALAKEFPVQARFFLGSTGVDPQNVNQTIEPLGLKKMETHNQIGLEVTYPIVNFLEVGLRYSKKFASSDEKDTDLMTDYSAKVDQDAVLLLARVPVVKTDIFRADVFAGFGGTNTTFKLTTAGQNGELKKSAAEGWFSTPYTAAGASVGLGYKKIYLFAEGGVETNKVDGFERSGSINGSLSTVDLSGSYFMIGLMIDGIPGSFK